MRTAASPSSTSKPCTNPHDRGGMPKYLPDGMTQYVLNNFTKKKNPDITCPKTTYRRPSSDQRWKGSLAINRSVVRVGSSR